MDPRLPLALCALLTAGLAGCSDAPAPADAPAERHLGDSWVYRLTLPDGTVAHAADRIEHQEEGRDGAVLAHRLYEAPADEDGVLLPTGRTVWRDATGGLLGVLSTFDAREEGASADVAAVQDRACPELPPRFVVGQTTDRLCSQVTDVRDHRGETLSRQRAVTHASLEVLRHERVTVPAGTFDAWLVEATHDAFVGNEAREVRTRSWYAPDACGVVRYEGAYEDRAELVGYRCGDRQAGMALEDAPGVEPLPLAEAGFLDTVDRPARWTCPTPTVGVGAGETFVTVLSSPCRFRSTAPSPLDVGDDWVLLVEATWNTEDPSLLAASLHADGEVARGDQPPLHLTFPFSSVDAEEFTAYMEYEGVSNAPGTVITFTLAPP